MNINKNRIAPSSPIKGQNDSYSKTNSNNMSIKIFNQGKDFNDYEIKNKLSGQTSRTRVVFLAD